MEFIDVTRYVIALVAICLMIWSIRKFIGIKENEYERKKYAQLSFLYGASAFCMLATKITIFVTFD